ncbi:MAG: PilZ domain-containing protein [Gammaproteobacteria bacterium]|jgi:hypothetical protein
MRAYIRHPADIPVQIELHSSAAHRRQISNVSYGGLAFESDTHIEAGSQIRIRIDMIEPAFVAEGIVSYCRNRASHYLVGVEFIQRDDLYIARMVEQICHIEHYKQQVAQFEGRDLSAQEAAQEWISKYASRFPHWGT